MPPSNDRRPLRPREQGVRAAQHRLRKRNRKARQRRHGKRVVLVGVALIALVSAAVGVGFGAGTAFSQSCELSSLHSVRIGQNSFVYAADGSLLGSIPAEKNREPVDLTDMSKWVPRATVAIEDRRFWTHG